MAKRWLVERIVNDPDPESVGADYVEFEFGALVFYDNSEQIDPHGFPIDRILRQAYAPGQWVTVVPDEDE